MQTEVKDVLWAKKAIGEDGMPKYLSLTQHLKDTESVIINLYNHYLSDNQRVLIKEAISKKDAQADDEAAIHLVGFLGLIHDIGKATPAFQSKKSYQNSHDLDDEIRDRLTKYGFLNSVYKMQNASASPHALAGESLLKKFGVNDDIGATVGGHHGKPVDYRTIVKEQIGSYTANYYLSEDNNDTMQQKWQEAQNNIMNYALEHSEYNDVEELPRIKGLAAQVILEGLLIMADWIASNENYFPLVDFNQSDFSFSSERYEDGWNKWSRTYSWLPEFQRDSHEYYQKRFGFTPSDLQEKTFNILNQIKDPGIVILEAGMGLGKTEVALAAVEQLAQKNGCDGMFYCLPTQATTNGIFPRIEEWLETIAKESDDNQSIQLVHGKAALNEKFTEIPHYIDIGNDEEDAGVLVNEWFSGSKTAMLDSFVVGTVDQLLLLALKKKHLALRHLGFSKKVVVIDEAHAFDSYMQHYLYRALNWLGKYHVPVVILSATLPAEKRMGLAAAYLGTKKSKLPAEIGEATAYPLVTYSEGQTLQQFDDFSSGSSTQVQVKRIDEDLLEDKLKNLLNDGGIAGIIVNTVYRAQDIAEKLMRQFDETEIEVLHSSFIATNRVKKEQNLINTIGKNGKRPFRKIIIGTQVLEQSLDIDFDVLFTDLAPMDLLMQRVGRLHRHSNNQRPELLQEPALYVLNTSATYKFEPGVSVIYGDYLLMRTQEFLPDKIQLPQDISEKVQLVYDESVSISLTGELEEKYNNAKSKAIKLEEGKINKAESFILDEYDEDEESLIGWLKQSSIESKSDAQGLAQVRDSEESVEVIVVQQCDNNGYKILGALDDISNHISEPKIAKMLSTHTLRLPGVLSRIYRLDKTISELEQYNRKYLSDWQNQSWLKGSLGIILDENQQFRLNGYCLTYDTKLGLKYEEEGSNGTL